MNAIQKRIEAHRAAADDLERMQLRPNSEASIFRDWFVEEERAIADKLESMQSKVSTEKSVETRNCDRFNTGSPRDDFNNALKAYEEETGNVVYNICPGYYSSGDFILWLLSRHKENKAQ